MQSTDTITEQEDDIDFDSFVEVDEQVSVRNETGLARLKSCRIVENPPNGLPADYRNEYSSFTYDRYFVFEAEMIGEKNSDDVNVLIPAQEGHKEIDVAYKWADADTLSDLAGGVVPVSKRTKNSYRIEDFDGLLTGLLSVNTISKLADRDVFKYSDGDWKVSGSVVNTSSVLFFTALGTVLTYLTITSGISSVLGILFCFSLSLLFLYNHLRKR